MRCAVGLLRAEEVICRAWDEAMNTQPDSFTWNLMGMLNNCNYRVKVRAAERARLQRPLTCLLVRAPCLVTVPQ